MTKTLKPERSKGKTRRRMTWIGGFVLVVVVIAAAGLVAWRWVRSPVESGDPNVLVNLTTMVGKEAPWISLTDSEGKSYSIRPGKGRKYLFIFHMGSI